MEVVLNFDNFIFLVFSLIVIGWFGGYFSSKFIG